jgi:tRNA uridine 5-carboxymethylaminomethyl modification enzyme
MHLRAEAREKLTRVQPINLAQAARISGITPADVALILAHLEGKLRHCVVGKSPATGKDA